MCLVHTTGPCIEAEESMNFSPHDGHWLPAWRPKFTKATLPCTSEYRCDGNSVWDEGEGWSSGQAAAVWSSLGERARRRLGEGPPEWQKREDADWWKNRWGLPSEGTAIQRWSAVCCLRWDWRQHSENAASGRLHKPHSKIICCA